VTCWRFLDESALQLQNLPQMTDTIDGAMKHDQNDSRKIRRQGFEQHAKISGVRRRIATA
jgi:hypothetical protein